MLLDYLLGGAVSIGIGFYLKRFTKTGEDFFLAGREMTGEAVGTADRQAVGRRRRRERRRQRQPHRRAPRAGNFRRHHARMESG